MFVACDIFDSGWIDVRIELKPSEIDFLVERLADLKNGYCDHFHFRSHFEGAPGIGDIEFSKTGEDYDSNMEIEGGQPIYPDKV